MKRFRRRVFNVVAAVSWLIFLVVCIEWYRGYRVQDAAGLRRFTSTPEYPIQQQLIGFTNCQGAMWFAEWTRWNSKPAPVELADHFHYQRQFNDRWHLFVHAYSNPMFPAFPSGWINRWGFHVSRDDDGSIALDRAVNITIPDWFLAGCAAAMPMAWFFVVRSRGRRDWRMANGQCLACGYDLRATPERCPECGRTVVKIV